METKSEKIPNNSKTHLKSIPMKVCMLYMYNKYFTCFRCKTNVLTSLIISEHHFNMDNNVKQDLIDYS